MTFTVEIFVELIAESQQAILITDGSTDKEKKPIKHWIPKSQCNYDDDLIQHKDGKMYLNLEINEWLAKERGLI